MKWDYYTYSSQPTWFIDGLKNKINLDSMYQNRIAKQNKRRK